eukprot:2122944-Pyramimonas_sp.AAC.1
MDGGVQFTLSGVGFARSPWLKCAVAQPDPAGQFSAKAEPLQGYKSKDYLASEYRDNWKGLPATLAITMDTDSTRLYTSQVQYTEAETKFSEFKDSERIR